jgi:periplasmic divalent cation tolerance protein
MPLDQQIVLCTVPDRDTAERIAGALVTDQLAACVNIIPGITSVYRWKNRIEKDAEHLLIIKTQGAVFGTLQDTIRKLHPYELPEIIAVPIQDGLPEYLDWITTSLAQVQ